MKLLHVIDTRFNLGLYQRKSPREAEAWMEHRLALFRRVCLPSFQAQQSLEFHWIIGVDPATPAHHLRVLQDAVAGHDRWRVMPVHGTRPENLAGYVAGLATEPPRVITSRVDNDDAIHRLYVKSLQAMAAPLRPSDLPVAINFTNGFLAHGPSGRAAWVRVHSNAFVSLVEAVAPGGRPITVLARNHLRINQVARVAEVGDQPMWMALIHEENISNHLVKLDFQIPLSQVGPDFGIFPA